MRKILVCCLTLVMLITMLMKNVDEKKELLECSDNLSEECIIEKNEFQVDLINMLTVVTYDHYGVIRDYLNKRDENNEYFFGVLRKHKLDVCLLTSPEELYNYLVEENEWIGLIARKKN